MFGTGLSKKPSTKILKSFSYCCLFFFALLSLSQTADSQTVTPKAALPRAVEAKPSGLCKQLTDQEVQSIQLSSLKTIHASQFPKDGYRITQCVYQTEDVNRSISVSITETDPDDPQMYSVKRLWRKMFNKKAKDSEDREKLEAGSKRSSSIEEEEDDDQKRVHAKKVKGLGDAAFWITAESGSAFYILAGKAIVRISVGGHDDLRAKLQSSMAVARYVIAKL